MRGRLVRGGDEEGEVSRYLVVQFRSLNNINIAKLISIRSKILIPNF